MKEFKDIICANCKSEKKLVKKKTILVCRKCGEAYPIYKKIPIMLTKNNDIFHVKKALLPAKYRVEKYGS